MEKGEKGGIQKRDERLLYVRMLPRILWLLRALVLNCVVMFWLFASASLIISVYQPPPAHQMVKFPEVVFCVMTMQFFAFHMSFDPESFLH